MTHAATTIVPAESDLLCEGCGYTLNGLPETGNCPECGKPIAQSVGSQRVIPIWEQAKTLASFWSTSWQIIRRPTHFFQNLATRRSDESAARFAMIHWWMASIALGLAFWLHTSWYAALNGRGVFPQLVMYFILL